MIRRLTATMALAALLVGCAASGGSRANNAGSDTDFGPTWRAFCRELVKVGAVVEDLAKGTTTSGEAVKKLGDAQEAMKGDTAAAEFAGATQTAAQMSAMADAVGRFKVSVAAGSDIDAEAFGDAIEPLPSCAGPVPTA